MIYTAPHHASLTIARPSARFAAFLIDGLLWAVLALWLDQLIVVTTENGGDLISLVPEFLYFWLLHARYGQTLGKKVVGIKVVSAATGAPPSLKDSALRAGFFLLAPLIPMIGWIVSLADGAYVFWDGKRRCYHDQIVGTVVVTVPSKAG